MSKTTLKLDSRALLGDTNGYYRLDEKDVLKKSKLVKK
jgi:hypothetical protein